MGAPALRIKKLWAAVFLCMLLGSALALGAEGKEKKASRRDSNTVEVARRTRVRLGGITAGAFYHRYSGFPYRYYPYYYYRPYWGPLGYYGWPYYDLYGPMYYPGYGTFAPPQRGGEIKLQTRPKEAEVFIDGAYAGAAKDLKKFRLEPGAHDLEIKADDYAPFRQRIYVLSNKTLKVNVTLSPEKKEIKP
jgi:hypothetical protein